VKDLDSMRIRFGDFAIDLERRELTRQSKAVHLPARAFRLLEMLIANRPRAVAQRDLYDQLWPDTHVDPANLHNLIYRIREALGDEKHFIVKTVYGFGFAFDAPAFDDDASPAAVRWQLVIGDHDFDLGGGENLVGRDRDAAVRIDSNSISRRHARIVIDAAGVLIEDLGSKNGTMVNGRRVRQVRLNDGDRILFGTVAATFRGLTPVKSTETVR
jgi:DNA-binding winged helix-turn-helix (wHTH) protein